MQIDVPTVTAGHDEKLVRGRAGIEVSAGEEMWAFAGDARLALDDLVDCRHPPLEVGVAADREPTDRSALLDPSGNGSVEAGFGEYLDLALACEPGDQRSLVSDEPAGTETELIEYRL